MYAAKNAGPKVLSLLLEAGANVEIEYRDEDEIQSYRAIDFARENEKLEGTEALSRLERASSVSVRSTDDDDEDYSSGTEWVDDEEFLELCKSGDAEEVERALMGGANVDAEDKNGFTGLMYAARQGYAEVAEILLLHGAYVDTRESDGWTALMLAAYNDNTETVKLLLKHHADVNVKDNIGMTVLMYAAKKAGPKVLSLILDAGANVEVEYKGENDIVLSDRAIDFARENKKLEGTEALSRLDRASSISVRSTIGSVVNTVGRFFS